MMLRTETKTCKHCNVYKRIYRENWCRFWRSGEYCCTVRQEIVSGEGVCELWQAKRREYDFSKERFEQIEADLKALIKKWSKHNR